MHHREDPRLRPRGNSKLDPNIVHLDGLAVWTVIFPAMFGNSRVFLNPEI